MDTALQPTERFFGTMARSLEEDLLIPAADFFQNFGYSLINNIIELIRKRLGI
jgi:hypothetical protein